MREAVNWTLKEGGGSDMRKGVGRDGRKERKDGIVGEDNLQRQEKNLQRLVQDKWE